MQVVLLEDVKALGKKGQIVNVNDGYARNFILPKKLGVEANSKNLNDLKLKKANDDRIAAELALGGHAVLLAISECMTGSFQPTLPLHSNYIIDL